EQGFDLGCAARGEGGRCREWRGWAGDQRELRRGREDGHDGRAEPADQPRVPDRDVHGRGGEPGNGVHAADEGGGAVTAVSTQRAQRDTEESRETEESRAACAANDPGV